MGMSALEVRRRVMLAQPHEAVASGAVASFRTDVVSPLPMEFDLNPIQDLHGYDNPWPGGGGKNKFDISSAVVAVGYNSQYFENGYLSVDITKTATGISSSTKNANCGRAICLGALPAGEYILSFTNAGVQSIGFSITSTTTDVLSSTTGLSRTTIVSSQVSTSFTFTADGTSFYWLSAYKAGNDVTYSMQNIMVRLSSVSDTTYAPYSNICPISGHDGFTRTGTGKNLLPQTNYNTQRFTVASDGSVTQNNPSSATFAWTYSQSIMRVTLPPGKYTITETLTTAVTDSSHTVKIIDDKENTVKTVVIGVKNVGTYSSTFTLTEWTNLGVAVKLYDGVAKFSITPGETAQPYEPFGHSYTTTFPTPPGTVYGCHIKDNGDGTGTLVVCKVKFIPTSVDSIGTASTGVKYIACYLPTGMNAKAESEYNECISSEYKFRGASAPSDSGWFRVQPNIIYIFDDRFTSKATAESILADEKPQFVYELATPVQYTLSLTALQSLIGQNHVWVDNADSVTVEYWGH